MASQNAADGRQVQQHLPAAPPSVISSRMTDIASDDGIPAPPAADVSAVRRSGFASDFTSRPPTALTRMASRGKPHFNQTQPLRKNAFTKNGSFGPGSTGAETAGSNNSAGALGRTPSLRGKSKSHAPSLTSNAFFRPMSSQRLQKQRQYQQARAPDEQVAATGNTRNTAAATGAPRPITGDGGNDSLRHSVQSNPSLGFVPNPIARISHGSINNLNARLPPSRGTETTEIDRATANTTPIQGHRAGASLSESVRPLQRPQLPDSPVKNGILSADPIPPRGGYRAQVNAPSPIRTSRSFRSSFLLPGRSQSINGDGEPENRDHEGGEKLPSGVSTPRPRPVDLGNPKDRSRPRNDGNVHEYFEGNTVFCLGGRFQNSRQQPVNVATGIAIVLPCVLYFAFSASWQWHNLSPAVPLVFAYIFYLSISSFFHASVSDPGILPRNLHPFPPQPDDDPLYIGPPTTDWAVVKSADPSSEAMEVPVQFCRTCNIWRPPRAHHCRLCNNCIETHDHHCVWLNNCVGRRNYRHFFAFVSTTSLAAAYLVGASFAELAVRSSQTQSKLGTVIDGHRVVLAIAVIGVLGLLYPMALTGYHVFLMARGETTREFINSHKFVKAERYRAFTQGGWLRNWIAVLCRPRTPTYYKFKGGYQAGDQRLGMTRKGWWVSEVLLGGRARQQQPGVEMQDVKKPVSVSAEMGARTSDVRAL